MTDPTATDRPLVFVDTETTGLDITLHHVFEVAFVDEDAETPTTVWVPHTLRHAEPAALAVNRYGERVPEVYRRQAAAPLQRPGFGGDPGAARTVSDALRGKTIVGANPGFDIRFIQKFLGDEPWHHRPIDVETQAMAVFNWSRPRSLSATVEACQEQGYDIPENDHSAAGDTLTARAVYRALAQIRRERMVMFARPTTPVSLP